MALANPELTLADYLGSASRALQCPRACRDRHCAHCRSAVVRDGFTDEGRRFVERLLTAAVLPIRHCSTGWEREPSRRWPLPPRGSCLLRQVAARGTARAATKGCA